MGIQMAFAYIGTTLVPPTIGLIMDALGIQLYPVFIFILLVVMIISSERVQKIVIGRAGRLTGN
jgi:fucose permease